MKLSPGARRAAPALVLLLTLAAGLAAGYGLGRLRPPAAEEAARAAPPGEAPAPDAFARAERRAVPVWHSAPGTVRSRLRATLASRIGGHVLEVAADVGDPVRAGELLVTLESLELEARLAQAESAASGAEASALEALQRFERVALLVERGAAPAEELEAARAGRERAAAALEAARQAEVEARVHLDQARLASSLDGLVAERHVDPGDLAWPGRPLLELLDPRALRLEAAVPEGLIGRLAVGVPIEVEVGSPARTLSTAIGEILPAADPHSRSFLVRAPLPAADDLYPGMFARLRFLAGEREAVLVPARAVLRVGQLAMVLVEHEGRWVRRHVTLGRHGDDLVEVLSGLAGGERIGWRESGPR